MELSRRHQDSPIPKSTQSPSGQRNAQSQQNGHLREAVARHREDVIMRYRHGSRSPSPSPRDRVVSWHQEAKSYVGQQRFLRNLVRRIAISSEQVASAKETRSKVVITANANETDATRLFTKYKLCLQYQFVLILHNRPQKHNPKTKTLDLLREQHMRLLKQCSEAGLEIGYVTPSVYTQPFLIFLLRASAERLDQEKHELLLERWLNAGAEGEMPSEILEQMARREFLGEQTHDDLPNEHGFLAHDGAELDPVAEEVEWSTPAELMQAVARVVQLPFIVQGDRSQGAGISLQPDKHPPGTYACFALRDKDMDKKLYQLLGFHLILFPKKRRDVLSELRLQDSDNPNPDFKPDRERPVVDSEGTLLFMEPTYSSWKRISPRLLYYFLIFICMVVYSLGTLFFVQWYIIAIMTPACKDCPDCKGLLSCFDTDFATLGSKRWIYVSFQGILLGVLLDMFVSFCSEKVLFYCIHKENYRTVADVNRHTINRWFLLNWFSYYLWYLLIAFIFVPFGGFLEFILMAIDPRLGTAWNPTKFDMSTMLITPLLVTQFLNLFLDTVVVRFIRNSCFNCKKALSLWKSRRPSPMSAASTSSLSPEKTKDGAVAKKLDNESSSADEAPLLADKLKDTDMQLYGTFKEGSGSFSFGDKLSQEELIQQYEKVLDIEIERVSAIENDGIMSADDILQESGLPPATTVVGVPYLHLVIQYGFVTMFTAIWPLCAAVALLYNIVAIRGHAFNLCSNRRRPLPRRANGIGQWGKMLEVSAIMSLVIYAILVCWSTGELEQFNPECAELTNWLAFSGMHPNFDCIAFPTRFAIVIGLEHLVFLVFFVTRNTITDIPDAVKTLSVRKKEILRSVIKQGSKHSFHNHQHREDGERLDRERVHLSPHVLATKLSALDENNSV